jgi:hypothetical protein
VTSAVRLVPSVEPREWWSEDAEQAVLAATLIEPAAIVAARGVLSATDFHFESHQRLFRAALAVDDAGSTIDPITLADALGGDLEAAGGKDYIGFLVDAVPTAANVAYHAGIVLEYAKRRELIAMLDRFRTQADDGALTVADVATQMRPALDVLSHGTGAPRFTLMSDTEIDALVEPAPLVDGFAFVNGSIAIAGKFGSLKTFVLVDLAFCIACGADWHGRRTRQGPVVYVYAEGVGGIRRRVAAWKAAYGYSGSAPVHFLPCSVALDDAGDVTSLLHAIAKLATAPVAVMVDTLARNFAGDENSTADMGRFIRGVDRIREATGAAVFVAHHTGHEGTRARGSTALPGALDTLVTTEKDDTVLTLKCVKQKDAAEFAPIMLEAFPIAGSLALRAVVPTRAELTRNERTCLSLVQTGDGLSASQWEKDSGLAKGSFANARNRLLTLAYVKHAKRLYVATEAGQQALGTKYKAGTAEVQTQSVHEVQHSPLSKDRGVVPVLPLVGLELGKPA